VKQKKSNNTELSVKLVTDLIDPNNYGMKVNTQNLRHVYCCRICSRIEIESQICAIYMQIHAALQNSSDKL